MLHVFFINLVKLATRKAKMTIILGRREYVKVLLVRLANKSNVIIMSFYIDSNRDFSNKFLTIASSISFSNIDILGFEFLAIYR